MTSTSSIILEGMHAKILAEIWDCFPYDSPWFTADFHGMSAYSGYTISQLELPTARIAKTIASQKLAFLSYDTVYDIWMETLGTYLSEHELWHIVEGISVHPKAEAIVVHGGAELSAYLARNNLKAGEVHSWSMDRVVASGMQDNENREDLSDPEPEPQPQPPPRPVRDPWGYGYPMQGEDIIDI